jgi:hypothetical protein
MRLTLSRKAAEYDGSSNQSPPGKSSRRSEGSDINNLLQHSTLTQTLANQDFPGRVVH